MNLFDHILAFANEAQARAALPTFCSQAQEGTWNWDGSRVIAPISIITVEAVWEGEGMDRELVTPEQTLPGFWLAIALPELSAGLRDLPGDVCRLITDREAANAGQAFICYASPSVDPQVLASARVAPVFAGSRYPFGAV